MIVNWWLVIRNQNGIVVVVEWIVVVVEWIVVVVEWIVDWIVLIVDIRLTAEYKWLLGENKLTVELDINLWRVAWNI